LRHKFAPEFLCEDYLTEPWGGAGGLSASIIGRLKDGWSEEHVRRSKRDLSAKHVYFWVDGIHVRGEHAAQCLLVIIGATPEGKKELVGLIDGVPESAQSWRELLLDLKRRGLAMGTRTRGCARGVRRLRRDLGRQIRQGGRVLDQGSRRAAGLLRLPGRALEASAHNQRHRKLRHRTVRSKGCLSNKTALAMIFKLAEAGEKNWRSLNGHNKLPKVILGVKFTDGIELVRSQAEAAAA
jgi:hypothetical protein